MATESKWEAPAAIVTYLTGGSPGGIDSLADGGKIIGSAAIDNEADGENEMFINLELTLAAPGSAYDADGRVEVYFLYSVDNTAFAHGDATYVPRPENLAHVFSLEASTAAQVCTAVNIPIAPLDFKILVLNESGQALAAASNYLKYRLHSAEAQ